jgi:hypothetical protein
MFFCWVKSNAGHSFALTVLLFKVGPWHDIHSGCLAASCCLLVAKHLKVVLEDIDNFIGL